MAHAQHMQHLISRLNASNGNAIQWPPNVLNQVTDSPKESSSCRISHSRNSSKPKTSASVSSSSTKPTLAARNHQSNMSTFEIPFSSGSYEHRIFQKQLCAHHHHHRHRHHHHPPHHHDHHDHDHDHDHHHHVDFPSPSTKYLNQQQTADAGSFLRAFSATRLT